MFDEVQPSAMSDLHFTFLCSHKHNQLIQDPLFVYESSVDSYSRDFIEVLNRFVLILATDCRIFLYKNYCRIKVSKHTDQNVYSFIYISNGFSF